MRRSHLRCATMVIGCGKTLDDQRTSGWGIGSTNARDDPPGLAVGRTEIREQYLILVAMDQTLEFGLEGGQLARIELCHEYGILCVITLLATGSEDRAASSVVGDIVGNEIAAPLTHRVVTGLYVGMSPRSHRASMRACKRIMTRQLTR